MTPATRDPATGRTDDGKRRTRGELVSRVVSALVMAAAAIVTAWAGGPLFGLFWFLAALAVLWEWLGLVGTRSWRTGLPGAAALAFATALSAAADARDAAIVIVLGAVATASLAPPDRRAIAGFGTLYAGALVVALVMLRRSVPDGLAIVVWLFAVVWGTDTMAFFGGRLVGGPKLAPRLSPSKTWSGFIAGVVSGATLGLFVSPTSDRPVLVFLAGLAGGALAQAGDLFESALKRRFGAKDAGSLIPGHGGVMDRLDGFIATSAFAALVGLLRFGPQAAGAGLLKW